MLQAMNTGHDGSLSTVHANAPRDALARIETMVLMAGFDLPSRAIREQIASALNLVVHIERFRDGRRVVANVTEVLGMEGDVITMQDVFKYDWNERRSCPPASDPGSQRRLHDHGINCRRGCSRMIALGRGDLRGLASLVLMAMPGPRVSKSRLGIERESVSLSRSMDGLLERHGKRQALAHALNLAGMAVDPGTFVLRVFLGALVLLSWVWRSWGRCSPSSSSWLWRSSPA